MIYSRRHLQILPTGLFTRMNVDKYNGTLSVCSVVNYHAKNILCVIFHTNNLLLY